MAIKFKRGPRANLPQLMEGEPAITLDTKELFVGTGSENVQFPNLAQVLSLINEAVGSSGVTSLRSFDYSLTATTEGQTNFTIPLSTFDKETDTLMVSQNTTFLHGILSYDIVNRDIVLKRGVKKGTMIYVLILKNVIVSPNEGTVSGNTIIVNSMPMNRVNGLEAKLAELEDALGNVGSGISSHVYTVVATTENQTVYEIPLTTFDKTMDTLILNINGWMSNEKGYSVTGRTITLTQGQDIGTEINMIILKNVPMAESIAEGFRDEIRQVREITREQDEYLLDLDSRLSVVEQQKRG